LLDQTDSLLGADVVEVRIEERVFQSRGHLQKYNIDTDSYDILKADCFFCLDRLAQFKYIIQIASLDGQSLYLQTPVSQGLDINAFQGSQTIAWLSALADDIVIFQFYFIAQDDFKKAMYFTSKAKYEATSGEDYEA